MNGWMQIGDDGKKIPIGDISIRVDEYHEEFDHERRKNIKVADKVSFELKKPSCEKCKNLISILQEVNGEIMHCGYNCQKTSMRADSIEETKRCILYQNI